MTTRIPYIRWCGAVRCGGASSLHKRVDRLVVGQSRVLTQSISVAVTEPLHFQSDVQQRRFFASPAMNNYKKLLSDDLVVLSFSSAAGDVATSKRDDTNQVCIRYALMAASIYFSFIRLTINCKTSLCPHSKSFQTPNLEISHQHKNS